MMTATPTHFNRLKIDTRKVLAIVGVSGSGKTVLANSLISMYPEDFFLPQAFTTRARRDATDTYIFVDDHQYGNIRASLIGRTNFNGKKYGTLLNSNAKQVNIMLLTPEALQDVMSSVGRDDIFVLILDRTDFNSINEMRPDRSVPFLEQERNNVLAVVDQADYVYRVNDGFEEELVYPNPVDIAGVVKSYFEEENEFDEEDDDEDTDESLEMFEEALIVV